MIDSKKMLALGAVALAGAACAMEFVDLSKPASVTLDGAAAEGKVTLSASGDVSLKGVDRASTVELTWKLGFGDDVRMLAGAWERTYANAGWRTFASDKRAYKGWMPWYFLADDGKRTDGYGVKVQPNAFAAWFAKPGELKLRLDVRAGTDPVELNGRPLVLCTLVSRRGRCKAEESAFDAGRAFCRMMCPEPRLPKGPVYGYNDWNCYYADNTATNFIADVAHFVRNMDKAGQVAVRPYAVVDDGWQFRAQRPKCPPDAIPVGGPWVGSAPAWGMDMKTWGAKIREAGARPGLWYRPLTPWKDMPENWKLPYRSTISGVEPNAIDITADGVLEHVRGDIARFRSWGMEMLKIDFITSDWCKQWGCNMTDSPVTPRMALQWRRRDRTAAEVVKEFYRTLREAAGDDVLIIGCNAIDHFAAGLFELQRTGDDTSGRGWPRTRDEGVNTLAMRSFQNDVFYRCDPDAVAETNTWNSLDHRYNAQLLDLIARSGTALFIGWRRECADDRHPQVRDELAAAWRNAAKEWKTARPLDWFETDLPDRWRLDGEKEETRFDWGVVQPTEAGFTVRLSIDLTNAKGGEKLYEIPGCLTLSLREADPKSAYDARGGNYLPYKLPDGTCPVLEALMPSVQASRVGIPLGFLKNRDGVHEVILNYAKTHFSIAVDGHMDDDMLWQACPPADPKKAKVLSPRVKKADFAAPAVPDVLPLAKDSRPITASVQYWTPADHNAWVGDVATGFYKGRYHVFYLFDRRHHGSKAGKGGHYFAHLSSADLVHWDEHPHAAPIENWWETHGTGTPFEYEGKLHLAYGLHTSRCTKDPKWPIGATYAVSEDGIHFKKSNRIIHTTQNPTIYNRWDGKLGLVAGYGGMSGIWTSDHLGDWVQRDDKIPASGDCPCPFEWNGHHYLYQGFNGFAYSPSDKPGTYVDWTKDGFAPYEGLSVPMVAPFTGNRRIMAGWLNHLHGWGGWLVFRELIQYPDGKLGTKWVPEIKSPVPPQEFTARPGEPFRLVFKPSSGKGAALVFTIDPETREASFRDDTPDAKWGSPNRADSFKIRNVPAFKAPYAVKVVQYYDRKCGITVFDVEIGGARTMICRRNGKFWVTTLSL